MTTTSEIHDECERLLQQLGDWKFIMYANYDVLEKDPVLKEFLALKFAIAEEFIVELQDWERLGNQGKCRNAIDNVQYFLGQIQALIDHVLDQHEQKDTWLDIQKDRVMTSYIYALYVDI